jgi:hypothetical protein
MTNTMTAAEYAAYNTRRDRAEMICRRIDTLQATIKSIESGEITDGDDEHLSNLDRQITSMYLWLETFRA